MTNISKEKRDLLVKSIDDIQKFIENAAPDSNRDNLLSLVFDIKKELSGKKYGLIFEEHREHIDELLATHVPILSEKKDLYVNNGGNVNFLIEGDNLAALEILKKTHFGKIDVIYIDPPYNRGIDDDDFTYNDNYIDAEDSFRHSKWISFMKERLLIANKLLSPHGTIFISCDDNEIAPLRLLCDEIFGYSTDSKGKRVSNYQGHIHWRRRHNQPNDKNKLIGLVAEHILVYSKNADKLNKIGIGKIGNSGTFSNPDNDPKGPWATNPWKAANGRGGCKYEIITPTGKILNETWYGTMDTFKKYLHEKRVHWTKNGDGIPRIKTYKFEAEAEGQCANNWWTNTEFGCNQDATDELKQYFGGRSPFKNPKPTKLIKTIIKLGCIRKDAIILDFFAGSGTTGDAVLKANAEDGGDRRFILCTNNQNDICSTITYPRLKKAIVGYEYFKKNTSQLFSEKLTYNRLKTVPELLDSINSLIEIEKDKYDEIESDLIDGVLTVNGINHEKTRSTGNRSSLKYYKIDFVPICDKFYYEYADELLKHTRELVELENGINFQDNLEIAIVLTDEELDSFIKNCNDFKKCRKLYIGHDVLMTGEQEQLFREKNIVISIIPDYYYHNLEN